MKSGRTLFFCILGILFLIPLQQIQGQEKSNNVRRTWLGLGAGAANGLIAGSANLTFQFDKNLISLRTWGATTLCVTCEEDQPAFRDYSVLYGCATLSRSFHASLAAGPGIVAGNYGADDPFEPGEKLENTIGLALEGQLFVYGSHAGIGLYGFANINSQKSFYGLTLSVQLGDLR